MGKEKPGSLSPRASWLGDVAVKRRAQPEIYLYESGFRHRPARQVDSGFEHPAGETKVRPLRRIPRHRQHHRTPLQPPNPNVYTLRNHHLILSYLLTVWRFT